jgi:polar amino acid transport system substrate-binding protein
MRVAIGVMMVGGMILASACGGGELPAGAAAELAPTGSIRAALNFANRVLARRGEAGGEPAGVSADLARELGRRLDVPVRFLSYESAAAMADAARAGEWDIAFLAADPAREETIAFTAPYLELDATYLVPAGSRIRTLDEVDAPGVRIAARSRSDYDLFLRRSLTQGTLVYPRDAETDLDVLVSGRADVLAGLRHALADTAAEVPGLRLLDGRFAAMQQAIGVPRGRAAAEAYLRAFVEDVKASGLVAKAIAVSRAQGVSAAPPAAATGR